MSRTAVKGVQGADTRLDVAYVVTQLSRFMYNPGQQHWKAAIRVFRYLKILWDYLRRQ